MSKHKRQMSISSLQLQNLIHRTGFPIGKREQAFEIVMRGLQGYRDYKKRSYYGPKGKPIKKPTLAHHASIGRPDQEAARTILISALCRAWWQGFGKKPTLNKKRCPDSPFFGFAMEVMALEGIGHIHKHLERYWSIRKRDWLKSKNNSA